MSMVKCLLAFVVLGCLVSSSITQIAKPCPNYADASILIDDSSVAISGCTEPPCVLHKGKDTSFSFNFKDVAKDNSSFSTLSVSVYGKIIGQWVELPGGLNDSNICDLGVTCPIKSGTSNTVKFNVHINPSFPSVSVIGEVRIIDDKKKAVQGCSEVSLKLE